MPASGHDMGSPHEATADRLQLVVPQEIRAYKQWLVWRYEPGPDKPRKVPYYVSGARRSGVQGGAADLSSLSTFDAAVASLRRGAFDGVGLAVLENSPIKAIDLDNCVDGGRLSADAEAIVTEADSYSELSPSQHGIRILVYGVLPSKKAMNYYGPGRHLELFGTTGFVTITGNVLGDSGIRPMSHAFQAWITNKVGSDAPVKPSAPQLALVIDERQRSDLRSALNYLDADNYAEWIDMGMALKSLGDVGRGLWMEWSQQSARFDAKQSADKWRGFEPTGKINYQTVFYRAVSRGWVNPASSAPVRIGSAAPEVTMLAAEHEAHYVVVPFDDLGHIEPAGPSYCWDGYVPVGVVTLLGAHGGAGKSTIALMLAVCTVVGLPLFGVATRQSNVLFFSGEDPAETVRYRLRKICLSLGVSVADLAGKLHILDATNGNPVLYREDGAGRRGSGILTQTYAALMAYAEQNTIGLVIVDNASDAYDASEIDRAKVRAFMRSLVQLAQACLAGVLLLAHVDKVTARGMSSGSDAYSGSTAWHNSARSRLFLSRDKDGSLMLEHQKHNLGRMREPLRLQWPEGGMPQADQPLSGVVQGIADRNELKALLRLLHEFFLRGEFVAASQFSTMNAARVLSSENTYPKCKPAEIFDLLRNADRRGLIERQVYRDASRKNRERWALTAAGCVLIGAPAPTAPTARTYEDGTQCTASAGGAPTAPTCGAGGVGGSERTQVGANSDDAAQQGSST